MGKADYKKLKNRLINYCAESNDEDNQTVLSSDEHMRISKAPQDTLLMLVSDTRYALAGSILIKPSTHLKTLLSNTTRSSSMADLVGVLVLVDSKQGIDVVTDVPVTLTDVHVVTLENVRMCRKGLISLKDGIVFKDEINKYFICSGDLIIKSSKDLDNIRYRISKSYTNKLVLTKELKLRNKKGYVNIHSECWNDKQIKSVDKMILKFNELHLKAIEPNTIILNELNRLEELYGKEELYEYARVVQCLMPDKVIIKTKIPPSVNLLYLHKLMGDAIMNGLYEKYKNDNLNKELIKYYLGDEPTPFKKMDW